MGNNRAKYLVILSFIYLFICLLLCSLMQSFVHTECTCLRKKQKPKKKKKNKPSYAGQVEDHHEDIPI